MAVTLKLVVVIVAIIISTLTLVTVDSAMVAQQRQNHLTPTGIVNGEEDQDAETPTLTDQNDTSDEGDETHLQAAVEPPSSDPEMSIKRQKRYLFGHGHGHHHHHHGYGHSYGYRPYYYGYGHHNHGYHHHHHHGHHHHGHHHHG